MNELVLGQEIPNDVYLKMSVEQRLNMVNYDFIGYIPSEEALFFVNFIKEVNGGEEENETPVVHLVMMDSVFNGKRRCAILVFRGAGKLQSGSSKLLSDNGWITMNDVKVGSVLFGMDGKKTTVTHKTEPQYPQMYKMTLSDGTILEVGDKHNHQLINSKGVYSVKTTDEIYDSGLTYDAKERKSSRSPKNIYKFKIPLCRPIEMDEVTVDIHPYVIGYGIANGYFNKSVVSTHIDDSAEIMQYFNEYGQEILSHGSNRVNAYRFKTKGNIYKKYQALSGMKSIPSEYKFNSIQNRIELLRGIMDGDGTICINGSCRYSTFSLRLALDVQELVQSLGGVATVKKYNSEYVVRIKIQVCPFKLKRKADKWRPAKIKTKAIIGLEKIECKEAGYCIVVDNASHTYITEGYTVTHNTTLFGEYLILFIAAFGKLPGFGKVNLMLYVTDSIENGVKNLRRNVEFRYSNSEFLRKMIPNKKLKVGNYDTSQWVDVSNFEEESMKGEGGIKFTDIRLEFENNKGHKLVVKGYGARTGVRGAKEMGQRPSVALLDDLLSDEDSRSPTIISSIENTIYKAVSKALHPTRQKIIWLGTPFNQKDPLYKAVESGAWNVSCFPICEWFDENTTEETFKGAWSDRFPYKYVKAEFDEAKSLGRLHDFYQELMLRIMSEDERLVLDSDIFWYKRNDVLKNKDRYNWYITTDFATSEKTSADFSVISVWAYNNNGDWLWVDGIVKRQLMDKNVSDLFKLVQKYKPMSVGIEISGQQGGFVSWVKNEMIQKNIYFNLARNEGSNKEGLMPNTNKLVRFNTVVPLFKAGKIWLPEEMKSEEPMIEAMNEIRGASMSGFKSKHDDWLDTVSMLSLMNAFKPSIETEYKKRYEDDGIYMDVEPEDDNNWTGRNGIF